MTAELALSTVRARIRALFWWVAGGKRKLECPQRNTSEGLLAENLYVDGLWQMTAQDAFT